MANDVSYFKIPGDNTQYSFNDADAESDITTLNGKLGSLSTILTGTVQGNSNGYISIGAGNIAIVFVQRNTSVGGALYGVNMPSNLTEYVAPGTGVEVQIFDTQQIRIINNTSITLTYFVLVYAV